MNIESFRDVQLRVLGCTIMQALLRGTMAVQLLLNESFGGERLSVLECESVSNG